MTANNKPIGPATWLELCGKVRMLLLSMDLEAGDIMEAAVRVEMKRGSATALAYKEVLAELGQDIDQPTLPELIVKRKQKEHLEAELYRAARYLKRDAHG